MKCNVCGAEISAASAQEIRPGYYRCNYCASEFAIEEPKAKAEAPAQTEASKEAKGGKKVLSGDEIYDKAIGSVVEIYATNPGLEGYACASGFVLSEQGLVITNAHAVITELGTLYQDIKVKCQDKLYQAQIVAIGRPADNKNNNIDLCLLFVHGLKAKPEAFSDYSAVKNGQKVYLIGNSLGMGSCITSGIISDKARAMPGLKYPYIMTDVAANHGNSGGPLYNEKGEVIGVLVAGIDSAEGMNYAIPSSVAEYFLSYVVKNTELSKLHIKEFEKYESPTSTYSLALIFDGIKLAMDVIEYIVKIFKRDK